MRSSSGTKRVISRFEHDVVRSPRDISQRQFALLARYHDSTQSECFSLGYNSIKLNQYVGVIQVGDTVIEVLPKIDRTPDYDGYPRWRRTLLEMLEVCQKISPREVGSANQTTRHHSLLDIILDRYLDLVSILLQQGLVRRYIDNESNVSALKGRILFSQHLSKNLIRPDRWYTHHTVYDRNHQLHGMLKKAIEIVHQSGSTGVQHRARLIAEEFADFDSFTPTQTYMERLEFNRKTERYRSAIQMAWLIIQSYTPDFVAGGNPVIALMFDMNRLYEETVYRLLDTYCRRSRPSVSVSNENRTKFWQSSSLEPDIIMESGSETVVIDTKWKRPHNDLPSANDLRQVFTYNLYYGSNQAVLLYPAISDSTGRSGPFQRTITHPSHVHGCQVRYATLNDADGHLSSEFARALVDELLPGKKIAVVVQGAYS